MRTVILVAYDGVQLLDLVGPLEVFAAANTLWRARNSSRPEPYAIRIATRTGRSVTSSNGLPVAAHGSLTGMRGPLHTVLVPGALLVEPVLQDRVLITQLRRLARRAKRLVSVCSGAFLLAEAGLLDGRRVTTHWAACKVLSARYPNLTVETDPIYVKDGGVYTSAGVTAGLDLSLALVESDLGREAALELARWFVMYLRRPGGQSQFSAHLATQGADREPIQEVLEWIAEHPSSSLAVAELAKRARMSPRNFARVFQEQTGTTPARHVARIRLEVARRRLEETKAPLKQIARDSGHGTVESLRRAFHAALQITPGDYRARFQTH